MKKWKKPNLPTCNYTFSKKRVDDVLVLNDWQSINALDMTTAAVVNTLNSVVNTLNSVTMPITGITRTKPLYYINRDISASISEGSSSLPPLNKGTLKDQSPPAASTASSANSAGLPELSVGGSCALQCMQSHNHNMQRTATLNQVKPSVPVPSNDCKPKTMVATPEQVMKLYINKLTPYEHHEIFNYPEIYFIGANAKKRPGIIGNPNNCDYDNDQGSYIHIPHDHVAYQYEVLKVIGKGSFGQVVKAYDHKKHMHVALKMVRNEKRFHRQAQEEVRILEHLRKQDKDNTMNIIHMLDYFTFRNHMCITFELLSINLYELIKKNKFKGFSLQLVRKFSHSLLQCLDALNRNKIIHCDMKPENVLLKQQGRSGLKVSLI